MSKKSTLSEKRILAALKYFQDKTSLFPPSPSGPVKEFKESFPNTNIDEELKKQKEAYVRFKRHFPDANDERFEVFDEDGKFEVHYKRGDGS